MGQMYELQVSELEGTLGFWSSGNKPTQDLLGLSAREVLLNFKVLYLLMDRVAAAASFFFESDMTRSVVAELEPVLRRGELLFFIDAQREDFLDHGREKMKKSPRGLAAYSDAASVREKGSYLNSFGHLLRRPSSSISGMIVDAWLLDLASQSEGSLGGALRLRFGPEELPLWVERLSEMARRRSSDFVWEYVGPELQKLGLPRGFRRLARRQLAKMYADVTVRLLDDHRGGREARGTRPRTGERLGDRDTALFLECMAILGVRCQFEKLGVLDLIALKRSPEFILFREFYFQLVETAAYQSEEVRRALPLYQMAEISFGESRMSREDFLLSFGKLWESIGRGNRNYAKPLEVLLHTYDLFRHRPIGAFVSYLGESAQDRTERAQHSKMQVPAVDFSLYWKDSLAGQDSEVVLDRIRNAGRGFEENPGSLMQLSEEDLRSLVVSHLRSPPALFAGGEVLRRRGRVDILVQGAGGACVVAECKLWRGRKYLRDACDQLLGYVTWRDRLASLIVFNKRVGNFSGVRREVRATLEEHPRLQSLEERGEDGEWRCTFLIPDDPSATVSVHVFVFNLFPGK